jgi:hypothetical protein
MVKEPAEGYGRKGRTLQAGAALFAAVVVGGVLLWKEVRQRPTIDAAPVVPVASADPPVPVVAPVSIAAPPAGPAEKKSARPGHPPTTISRNPDPSATPVKPAARLVRVETDPPGASVLLESGASIGKTPLQMDVASLAGRKVVLSKEGYERQSVPADALAAGPAFRAELQSLFGTVEAIQAIPWAKVYLGNRLLGETPLTAVRLPAGEQRLRFVNEPLGVDQVRIIVVRPGDNPKVIVPMTGSGRR